MSDSGSQRVKRQRFFSSIGSGSGGGSGGSLNPAGSTDHAGAGVAAATSPRRGRRLEKRRRGMGNGEHGGAADGLMGQTDRSARAKGKQRLDEVDLEAGRAPREEEEGGEAGAGGETELRRLRAERCGPLGLVRSDQMVRSMEQELISLGFPDVAALLERRSGVQLCSGAAKLFSDAVMEGAYADALAHLRHVRARDVGRVRQMLLEAKIHEDIEHGEVDEALRTIREDLEPTGSASQEDLQRLCVRVVCAAAEGAAARAPNANVNANGSGKGRENGDGKKRENGKGRESGGRHPRFGPEGRRELLDRISRYIPAEEMLPSMRLTSLVEHALLAQRSECVYFNKRRSEPEIDMFEDFSCGRDQLPTEGIGILEGHTDEVWHLQFSNSGRMLASASRDRTAIIWDTAPPAAVGIRHTLRGHDQALTYVSWSPDDAFLLTASSDGKVLLWEADTGAPVREFTQHTSIVMTCAWLPDGEHFVSGGQDKSMYLQRGDDGRVVLEWHGSRINDLVVSPDGRLLMAVYNERKIEVHSLAGGGGTGEVVASITEGEPITSLTISRDGGALLVNLSSQKIHMWRLPAEARSGAGGSFEFGPAPDMEFLGLPGQKGRFVIRSCFGGSQGNFVASGSEDSQVYIWHRDSGRLLAVLPGHSGTVNSVHWNPTDHHMMASASDDGTVRIWGSKDLARLHARPRGPEGGDAG